MAFLPVLVEDLLLKGPGGLINVGLAAHYSTLLVLFLTKGLPSHREIWLLMPFLLTLLTAGLMAWVCWKVAGRWAGLLTLAIALGASQPVFIHSLAQGMRGHTWLTNAVLSALLILTLNGPEPINGWKMALATGAVGVSAAITLHSDRQFMISGLLPFVGAALLAWRLNSTYKNRRPMIVAGFAVGFALAGDFVLSKVVYAMGFRVTYMTQGVEFASPGQVLVNLRSIVLQVLRLGNADFSHELLTLSSVASLLMAGAIMAAFVAPLLLIYGKVRSRADLQPSDVRLIVYLSFWLLSAIGVIFSLALTTATLPETIRYTIPVFYSIAATAPAWSSFSPRRRHVAAAAAALFILLSAQQVRAFDNYPSTPLMHHASGIISFLEQQRATKGYAPYWGSHSLTYHSHNRIEVRPVSSCKAPASSTPCPFFVNSRTVWYKPEPGRRSFLLIDPTVPGSPLVRPRRDDLGPPASSKRFGQITVYVYDHDIARKFRP